MTIIAKGIMTNEGKYIFKFINDETGDEIAQYLADKIEIAFINSVGPEAKLPTVIIYETNDPNKTCEISKTDERILVKELVKHPDNFLKLVDELVSFAPNVLMTATNKEILTKQRQRIKQKIRYEMNPERYRENNKKNRELRKTTLPISNANINNINTGEEN